MSSSGSDQGLPRILPALLVVGTLAGCAEPDLYFDRRETVSLHAGDAVATNIAVQTIDPWPREAGRRDIAYNGDRMEAAGERYRTGKTTPLSGLSTTSVQFGESPGSGGDAGSGGAN